MRLSLLLFLGSLVTLVYAYGEYGAYERLWYYYAYTVDSDGSGKKIAPGCRGSAAKGRCTFPEFMKYIDEDSKIALLSSKVDPMDVDAAHKALVAGGYTRGYQAGRIRPEIKNSDKQAIPKLMEAMSGFLEGNLARAPSQTQTNLRKVTQAVHRMRVSASLPTYKDKLGNVGTDMKTLSRPIYDGSTEMVDFIDYGKTASANGKTVEQITDEIEVIKQADPGHSENVRVAERGEVVVSEACQASGSRA